MVRHRDNRSREETRPAPTALPRQTAALWLENLAVFVLLLVVAMRPLLMETYESARTPMTRALNLSSDLTPATTAWFGLAVWLAAAAATVAAVLARRPWRPAGFEAGWLLMLIGAVVSTMVASNKRLAINCSADWLTAAALTWTLVNLARRRFCVGLILAAIIASGAVSAVRCGMQVTIEHADTMRHYQEMKEKFWSDQSIPLDDPTVDLYERRMRAAEASGFFALANSQGAWLALAGFAALSMAALRNRHALLQATFAVLAAVLMCCIFMTGGRGAMLGALGSLFVLAVVWRFQERLRRRWRLLVIAGWVAVVVGTLAVAGHGLAHGGLPGSSLNFRWQYWGVTRQIITDHLWSGVGAGNFDRVYLGYKPIDYPEEIKDPHNFVLSVLAQWGVLGVTGLAVALVGASIVAARRWGRSDDPNGEALPGQSSGTIPGEWIAAGVGGFIALRFFLQSDLIAGGQGTRALLVFDLGFYGMLWCGVFAGVCWIDGRTRPNGEDDGAYRLPLAAGVCAFLLANTIDFSFFEPGTLTPFAAIAGLLLAGRERTSALAHASAARFAPLIAVVLSLAAFTFLALVPVARSAHWLTAARALGMPKAIAACEAAAAADPLDPTPLIELAEFSVQTGRAEDLTRAIDAINEAIRRDPDRLRLYQDRASALAARYQIGGSAADLLGALGAARRCVEMYPASPDCRRDLAELLAFASSETGSPQMRGEAIHHYEKAIELNNARPGEDEARRWSPKRIAELRSRIEALQVASRPATATAPGP